jgi:hypothetical protein
MLVTHIGTQVHVILSSEEHSEGRRGFHHCKSTRVAPEGTKVNLPVMEPDSNQTVLCQKWKRDDATWIHNNKIACYFVECGIFREEGGFHPHKRRKNVAA